MYSKTLQIKFIILFLLLFSISVSASTQLSINLYSQTYSAGSTLQAELSLNAPLKKLNVDNIQLYKNQQEIPITPFLYETEKDNYFLYFALPQEPGNYTLRISDVQFEINKILTSISVAEEFSIKDELPSLRITPAFFLLDKPTDLEIEIYNYNAVFNIEITASPGISHTYTSPQTLYSKKIRVLKFKATSLTQEKQEITLTSNNFTYTIPVWIKQQPAQLIESSEDKIILLTSLPSLEKTISQDKTLEGALEFKNNLNQTLTNIKFSLTGNLDEILRIDYKTLANLQPYETNSQYFWLNEQKNPQETLYSGNFIISVDNFELKFPIIIHIQESKEEIKQTPEKIEETAEKKEEQPKELFPGIKEIQEPEKKIEKTGKSRNFKIIFLIISLSLMFIIYLFLKKPPQQTFSEYLSKLEK